MRSRRTFLHLGGFSLIELLCSMAVIALLASLVIGGMGGNAAARLGGGGDAVAGLIQFAKEQAAAGRGSTVLVVAKTGKGAFRSMGVFFRQPDTQEWKQVAPWKSLPDGLLFDPRVDVSGSLFHSSFSAVPAGFPATVRIADEEVSSGNLAFLRFDSRGFAADVSGDPLRIRLVAGEYAAGDSVNPAGTANYYDLLVLQGAANLRVVRP